MGKIEAFLKNHWAFGAAFVIVQVVFIWMVTHGTWKVFAPESFGQFYGYQAQSILQGRLDVPLEAIGPEAFICNGKYYGYFGLTPSLLRIPLLIVFPEKLNNFSRAFMILWSGVTLLASYLILLSSLAWLRKGKAKAYLSPSLIFCFLLAVGLGSTNIFLASKGFIYHEANLCAVALALSAIFFIFKFCLTLRVNLLFGALLAASFSFLSRPIAGLSAMACLLFFCFLLLAAFYPKNAGTFGKRLSGLFPSGDFLWDRLLLKVSVILLLAVFAVMVHFGLNYAKFQCFDIPMKYHVQFIQDPARLAKIDGKLTHLANIPFNVYHYFFIFNLPFTPRWPYVALGSSYSQAFLKAKIDVVEPFVSIPVGMPALFLLFIAGFAFLCRRLSRPKEFFLPFALAILSLSGTFVLMVNDAVTYRYFHDFLPALVFSGAFGLCAMGVAAKPLIRRGGTLLLGVLCLISCYNNTMFSLTYQRLNIAGVEGPYRNEFFRCRDEFLQWQRTIDQFWMNQKREK